jgi:hypothetical protein
MYREKLTDDGKVIWRLNTKTRNGYYKVRADSGQFKYCKRVALRGFNALPSGLWREGYGLTAGGSFILQELYDKYKRPIELTLDSKKESRITQKAHRIGVTLNSAALTGINAQVRSIKNKKNEETRQGVKHFLFAQFSEFSEYKRVKPKYTSGGLAAILKSESLVEGLGDEDRNALGQFIPEYLSKVPGTLKSNKKLQLIVESLTVGRRVFLEKVVTDFKTKMLGNVAESTWQSFLTDYILLLRSNYGEVIDKASVSLQGKFPDFMLIDPYAYLDIYEIKKPATVLLKYDASRDNYYWSPDLSKAISQVENYLHQVQRNSSTLMADLRRHKNIEVNIVRPRGYIIAGSRAQLKNAKMQDDFRILNESLKSVDVLMYDELLQNLESFVQKLNSGSPGRYDSGNVAGNK